MDAELMSPNSAPSLDMQEKPLEILAEISDVETTEENLPFTTTSSVEETLAPTAPVESGIVTVSNEGSLTETANALTLTTENVSPAEILDAGPVDDFLSTDTPDEAESTTEEVPLDVVIDQDYSPATPSTSESSTETESNTLEDECTKESTPSPEIEVPARRPSQSPKKLPCNSMDADKPIEPINATAVAEPSHGIQSTVSTILTEESAVKKPKLTLTKSPCSFPGTIFFPPDGHRQVRQCERLPKYTTKASSDHCYDDCKER